MSKYVGLLVLILSVVGCVTRPARPEIIEQLQTIIDEQNTKYFVYSIEFLYSDEELEQLEEYRQIVAENRGARIPSLGQVVDRRMRTVVNGRQYCKAGFVEIERNIGSRLGSIKGECRDRATEEDKKRFGNKTERLGQKD